VFHSRPAQGGIVFYSPFGTSRHRVSFAPSCLVRSVVFHSRFSAPSTDLRHANLWGNLAFSSCFIRALEQAGHRVSFALVSIFCGIGVTFSRLTAQRCPSRRVSFALTCLSTEPKYANLLGFFDFASCFIRALPEA